MHHEIEVMTRRLELEKRRLARLDHELGAARGTCVTKGRSTRTDSKRRPSSASRFSALEDTKVLADGNRQFRSLSARPADVPTSGPTNRSALHKLEVNRKKLDLLNSQNSDLKLQIDQLRKTRMQLNGVFGRLKAGIKQRSSQLSDFVEESSTSRAVEDDVRRRVCVMEKQRDFERSQFSQEIQNVREQLQASDWEKQGVETQLSRATKNVQKKQELILTDEELSFSEAAMMRRIMKTAFLNCIQRRHIKQHQKSIAVFEQAFATIKQSTGISNIEEIVKIFVSLESKNYSLLTYVNHMNREIEALEGTRRKHQNETLEHQKHGEQHESLRHSLLQEMQKQLAMLQDSSEGHKRSCLEHQNIIEQLKDPLQQLAARIMTEVQELYIQAGPACYLPLPPRELRSETLPVWLDWLEQALGKFRDLIPGEDDDIFPSTAAGKAKQLAPKRFGGQATGQPLVKAQELPSVVNLLQDEMGASLSKKTIGALSTSQRAELLDEEVEEEDFGEKPFFLKDLKHRAEQSAARRKRRHFVKSGTVGSEVGSTLISKAFPRGQERRSSLAMPTADSNTKKTSTKLAKTNEGEGVENVSHSSSEAEHVVRKNTKESAQSACSELLQGGDSDDAGKHGTGASKLAGEGVEVSDEELAQVFLDRYKMSRAELQVVADRLGISLSHLCFLKQEFDLYDEDQSGYIDIDELRNLLKKLGEDPADDELNAAFKELDLDGSGEVEFFEFIEWFTATT